MKANVVEALAFRVIFYTYLEIFLKAMAVSVVVIPRVSLVLEFDEVITPACLNHLSD